MKLLIGEQREDAAFCADRGAHTGVDQNEQRELRRVLPQPQADRGPRTGDGD